MSTDIIVSYDGTSNDDDAVALGKMLAKNGASVALAYVRHTREFDPRREELAQHDAERRLDHGAALLGDPDVPKHIVLSASTGEGLEQLAESEGASLIVFGSDYRTPPGHAEPGNTAQHMLEGGPIAIAVAAAGLRTEIDGAIKSISVSSIDADDAAQQTASVLAGSTGAELVAAGNGAVDLIVVGSHGTDGRIAMTGATRTHLNSALGSVLIVPQGKPLSL